MFHMIKEGETLHQGFNVNWKDKILYLFVATWKKRYCCRLRYRVSVKAWCYNFITGTLEGDICTALLAYGVHPDNIKFK